KTAIELELFTAIAEGKQTAEDIGASCKASARGTRILCDFLVVHGLLTKHANRYALTPDSAVFLDKHSKAYVGGALRFLLLPSAWKDTNILLKPYAKAELHVTSIA